MVLKREAIASLADSNNTAYLWSNRRPPLSATYCKKFIKLDGSELTRFFKIPAGDKPRPFPGWERKT